MSLTIETIFGRRSDLWPAPLWYSSDLRSVCVADSILITRIDGHQSSPIADSSKLLQISRSLTRVPRGFCPILTMLNGMPSKLFNLQYSK